MVRICFVWVTVGWWFGVRSDSEREKANDVDMINFDGLGCCIFKNYLSTFYWCIHGKFHHRPRTPHCKKSYWT